MMTHFVLTPSIRREWGVLHADPGQRISPFNTAAKIVFCFLRYSSPLLLLDAFVTNECTNLSTHMDTIHLEWSLSSADSVVFLKQPQMSVVMQDDHFEQWLYKMIEMKGFLFLLPANRLLWIHSPVEYVKGKGWQRWCYDVNHTAGDYLIIKNHCEIWDHFFRLRRSHRKHLQRKI